MMFKIRITEADIQAVVKVLRGGQLSGRTPIVEEFEKAFAEYCGAKYAVAVNSGSSALFLALRAMDISDGNVICPAFGYIAVPNAIKQVGAEPLFIDVERDTGNIDPTIEHDFSSTRCILTIDTYGHPCDYDEIRKNNPGIPILQDAAEAFGAKYKGQRMGSLPHVEMTCFSLFANKTITTGEGGMIVTDNVYYADRLKKLRDQFSSFRKYYHVEKGYSLCMNAMSAALGLSQLNRVDEILESKKAAYEELLFSRPWGTTPLAIKDYVDQYGYWVFPYLTEGRPKIEDPSRPFFVPYSQQPPYSSDVEYPIAEYLYQHGVYQLI